MKFLIKLFLTICLSGFNLATYALPTAYTVIAPQCLANNLDHNNPLATSKHFSLLQVNRQELNQLIAAKKQKTNACGGFLNVTNTWHGQTGAAKTFLEHYLAPPQSPSSTPTIYSIHYTTQVNQLMTQLNPAAMWANLTTLTNFPDRYGNSDDGVAAINWVKDQVETLIKNSGRTDISIRQINTGTEYRQNSLVVKMGNSNAPGIVLGAHIDTLSGEIPKVTFQPKLPGPPLGGYSTKYAGNMPGADDDGTGVVTVLELAKVLINSHLQFNKPIYLIWYAAEEEGLIGSGYTVQDFIIKKIAVDAVIQFDMTGFTDHNDLTIWLTKDFTDPGLTSFLETLITTYVKQPVKYTACGYACSDHASWNLHGFKSAYVAEAEMGKDNSYFHTPQDSIEKLSLQHMSDFAKLGVAFAVELAS